MKRKLKTILELQRLREHQLETLEEAWRKAKKHAEEVYEAYELVRDEYIDYANHLEDRIDELYEACIGHEISRELIMEKKESEAKMRARLHELDQKQLEAKKVFEEAKQAQQEAHQKMLQGRTELEAVKELVLAQEQAIEKEGLRQEAKIYDEFSVTRLAKNKKML